MGFRASGIILLLLGTLLTGTTLDALGWTSFALGASLLVLRVAVGPPPLARAS